MRTPRSPLALLAVPFLMWSTACAGSPGGPVESESGGLPAPDDVAVPPAHDQLTIVVETSGGIAGMDWQVTLDGSKREIRLDRCRGCPWPTATSRTLSEDEVREIARAFVEAGVRQSPRQDFGVCEGCADQFFHLIDYVDQTGRYTIVGDGPSLPASLEKALNRVIWEEDIPSG